MKSVIIGTAGHIDHGKTTLVKALTGIDADRLQEEKRRGITIDLGFAHLEMSGVNGDQLRLGFVDVPGHERFVRNMLAGVGGIDLVMFVVAADESIKPQTREHFDICRLLAVPRGITVLTKSDLVDRETLEVVRLELEEFLRGSFLDTSHSPIVPVSSLNGAGLDQLKGELARVAGEVTGKETRAYFRLPVDRVFTMKGFGTVVTGTLVAGSVHKEDEVEVFPQQKPVRVRGIQVHGASAESAAAGQRTAINLAGATTEELERGCVLATRGVFKPTKRLDVSLSLLKSAKRLRDGARVHLHTYTAETVAQVNLHGTKELLPGSESVAQLRLADATLVLPGDRFIIRQFSPVITIGGGLVLDAAPVKQAPPQLREFLAALMSHSREDVLKARIARRGSAGLDRKAAVAETGWLQSDLEQLAAALVRSGSVVLCGEVLVAGGEFARAASNMLALVQRFHQSNPLIAGMSKEQLREELKLDQAVFAGLLAKLEREKQLEMTGEQVRIAGRTIVMKDDEAQSRSTIERAFADAGLKVPALKDVLGSLKIDKDRAQRIVTLLLRDKVLVKLSDELVFHQRALEELRKSVNAYKASSPKLDVAKFKDLTGVSRKYAIPLLEYLDRERVTRRVGDERVIL
ncbi:MAG: selenocysteine-specific translation elongation factor [Acidobacteriales bacterium]|nr:selenocysteine-specific translation elongation factor [Terriglobales bacterium]